ncbi:RNA methyltransferase [Spiroplasma endosymbiont of Amphibalanus improvisus]|uniref:TrmH family RNA methyltransferase n=1 Tax=Spiroplasma endosymbiont of Amphibalanus improvisus TaxID=3066327 RepID=UPI00313EF980
MEIITSLKNPKIQKIIKLIKNKKYRDEQQKFIIEGVNLVDEAREHKILDELIISASYYKKNSHLKGIVISDAAFNQIVTLKNYQGLIGICNFIDFQIDYNANTLVLSNISDPGNLGTLIRSAAAFNFKNVILINNCASVYNPKVIRSTQGYLFKVNVLNLNNDVLSVLKEKKYTLYGTYLNNSRSVEYNKVDKSLKNHIALLIGNEANGLDAECKKYIDININVPMVAGVDSLNAAIAGSIIMSYFL